VEPLFRLNGEPTLWKCDQRFHHKPCQPECGISHHFKSHSTDLDDLNRQIKRENQNPDFIQGPVG